MTPVAQAAWAVAVIALALPRWQAVPGFLAEFRAGLGTATFAGFLRVLPSHLAAPLLAALVWVACRKAGAPVRRCLLPDGAGGGDGWLSVAAGWGVLATAGYGLALAGLFRPAVLLPVAVLPFALPASGRRRRVGSPAADRRWALLAGLPALLALPLLVVPSPYIDQYQYHLAAPERFLRAGRFSVEHANTGFRLPLTAEMWNALPVALDRDEAAAWLSAIPFIAGLAWTARWAAAASGPAAAGLGLGIALALRQVLWVAITGKNDLAAAGLGVVGLVAAARGLTRASAAGFGLMAATKTSGLAFAGTGWLVHEAVRLARLGRGWRPDAGWLVLAAPVPAAWLLKSWLIDGDPLWPALSARIGNPLWDAEREAAFRDFFRVEGGMAAVPGLLLGVLRTESPALLVLLPALALSPPAPALRRLALGAAAAIATCAFVVQYEFDRLMLPALAALAFPCAASVARPGNAPRAMAAAAVLAAVAGWAPAAGTLRLAHQRHSAGFLAGARDRAGLRRIIHTTLDDVRTDAAAWAGVRTVLLVNDNAAYRFPGRVATESFHDRKPTWLLARDAATLPRLLARLRQMNATHLVGNVIREGLISPRGGAYAFHDWTDRQLDLFADFMRRHAAMVRVPPTCDHVNGAHYVWRISRAPLPPAGPVHLLPGLQSVRARIYRPWLERRDGAAARAIAEGLCRRYPDVLWLRAEAAYLAHLLDRQDSAYRDYAAVLRHGFIGDHPLIFFAEAAAKTGRVAEAIAALERSKVIYPDQIPEADRMLALGWAMRAQALIAARKPDEALAAGRRAVAHGPDQPASHAAVAHALLALGRLDEAAALYREILARWPLDPQAASVGRANLGWILRARAERARRTR